MVLYYSGLVLCLLQTTMNGRYHLLTKDLRDFVIQSIKEQHSWQEGNVEQLVGMPLWSIVEWYSITESSCVGLYSNMLVFLTEIRSSHYSRGQRYTHTGRMGLSFEVHA